jgi:hypothetical protein
VGTSPDLSVSKGLIRTIGEKLTALFFFCDILKSDAGACSGSYAGNIGILNKLRGNFSAGRFGRSMADAFKDPELSG